MDQKDYFGWLGSYTDAEKCMSAFSSRKEFFRVNTIKISVADFESVSKLGRKKSAHYGAAFELAERKGFQIGKTWEYFLGWLYPQSLSSILVSLVLDPKPQDTVLDVAASPGSKFSHMAMLMGNRGVLVGNDIKDEKISALYATINRMNIFNCIVTIRDGSRLDWKSRFDKILLDVPCSSLGSGPEAWKRWEPEHSRKIGNLQKRILFSAFDALKNGGEIVYSTCTYAKEENEQVVKNLLDNVQNAKLETVNLDVPHEPGLSEYGHEFRRCYRIYPQHLESEGFFIAKIRKVQ
jgi:NOL1/NOP2/sun family putative RNA methylase